MPLDSHSQESVTHDPSNRREMALEQAGWGWLQQDLPQGTSHCPPQQLGREGEDAGATSSKVNPNQKDP